MMATKILIVEDHEDCRELLLVYLQRVGYQVLQAASGEQGIEKALEAKPDLIIMDLGLPGINGIEATTRLKKNIKTAHIPVIAYTAWSEAKFKETAKKAGMVGFLTKPTPPDVLNEVIQKYLPSSVPPETGPDFSKTNP
jgi:two-component system, cell cycle response regulator DivK